VKTSENTNLSPEFLLKIEKQQEDSAMLPARNKQEHQEMIKNTETQQDRQNTEKTTVGKNKDQVGLQEALHLHRIIWKTPNAEIPKRIFPLLSKPSNPL